MAVLGKRKARPEPQEDDTDAEAIFRRHFEARFQPLAETATTSTREPAREDSDDESEWGGLSDDGEDEGFEDQDDGDLDSDESDAAMDEDEAVLEVVDHSVSQAPQAAAMSKREMKAFMVRLLLVLLSL